MAQGDKQKKFKVKGTETFEFTDPNLEFEEMPANYYQDELVKNDRPVLWEVYGWNPT